MSLNKATDVQDFLNSLNAGVFVQQLGQVLSDVGHSAVAFQKKGVIKATFEIIPKSDSENSELVDVKFKLEFAEPTKRGTRKEDSEVKHPMYVTVEGIKLFQERPTPQLQGLDAPAYPQHTGFREREPVLIDVPRNQ